MMLKGILKSTGSGSFYIINEFVDFLDSNKDIITYPKKITKEMLYMDGTRICVKPEINAVFNFEPVKEFPDRFSFGKCPSVSFVMPALKILKESQYPALSKDIRINDIKTPKDFSINVVENCTLKLFGYKEIPELEINFIKPKDVTSSSGSNAIIIYSDRYKIISPDDLKNLKIKNCSNKYTELRLLGGNLGNYFYDLIKKYEENQVSKDFIKNKLPDNITRILARPYYTTENKSIDL